jgi:hypothetical protein
MTEKVRYQHAMYNVQGQRVHYVYADNAGVGMRAHAGIEPEYAEECPAIMLSVNTDLTIGFNDPDAVEKVALDLLKAAARLRVVRGAFAKSLSSPMP